MTNKRVVVPEGSFVKREADWEEIHIPPPASSQASEPLIPVSSLPAWCQPTFGSIASLNRIQSRVMPKALQSDDNLLMCAPTGAGKTNVALMCMLRAIGRELEESSLETLPQRPFKMVYVAPMKALVQEVVRNMSQRLEPLGLRVGELTGDQGMTRAQLAETHLLVTTPEKCDVLTRRPTHSQAALSQVRLIIMDEIHLLHDDRGPVLESLIARSLMQPRLRLVGLSATLPNWTDVAALLRCPEDAAFLFDGSYRPCPLRQQFVGVQEKGALKRQLLLNRIVWSKAKERLEEGSQCLIFVHSRKDTAKTAKYLIEQAIPAGCIPLLTARLAKDEADQFENADLNAIWPYGIGIHHAGLSRADRSRVEEAFAQGRIQLLISTATLAWGVNLPARTVMIKGTEVYSPARGRWEELSAQDVLQMLGRAGRPQYDTQGEGIIITTQAHVQFYLALLNQQLPVESQLLSKLEDALNAEVALGVCQSLEEAQEWLTRTYLHVRSLREPALYRVTGGDQAEWRRSVAHTALAALDRAHLVRYERLSGRVTTTELGRLASQYYLTHQTMAIYLRDLRPTMREADLFRVLASSHDFSLIPVRQEERQELAQLADRCPIPVRESLDEPVAKMNLLLQAYISRLRLPGMALSADLVHVAQSAGRLSRALFELCLRRGWARVARAALQLALMIERCQWRCMSPLRQLQVDEDLARRLERRDFAWERLLDLNPQELGELVRVPGAGSILHAALQRFPRVKLQALLVPLTAQLARLDLCLQSRHLFDPTHHWTREPFWIMVSDGLDEQVLHVEPVALHHAHELRLSCTLSLPTPIPACLFVTCLSDRWLGAEHRLAIPLTQLVMPAKSSLPHNITTDEEKLEARLAQLLEGGESLLICAPPAMGKTTAVLDHVIGRGEGQTVIYVQPNADRLERVCARLPSKPLPLADPKQLATPGLYLATPHQLDQLTRRWRQRKLPPIHTVILDDLDELEAQYELVASRLRIMSTVKPIRLIGISLPLGNAGDVAAWLGVAPANCVSQSAASRNLTVHLEGLVLAPNSHHDAMLLTMVRPLLRQPRGSLVWLSDRRSLQTLLPELLLQHAASDWQAAPCSFTDDQLRILWQEAGILVAHEGLGPADLAEAMRLGREAPFAWLLATVGMRERIDCKHLQSVILAGTQQWTEWGWRDYDPSRLHGLLAHANRAVLLGPASRKGYWLAMLGGGEAAMPLESNLVRMLPSLLNAEIATGAIASRQQALDWLTWTLCYRRLVKNPLYYGLAQREQISEHLSGLIEPCLGQLVAMRCIADEEDRLSALNLGMIAAYYAISPRAIDRVARGMNEAMRLRGIMELVTVGLGEQSPLGGEGHWGEERLLERLAESVPLRTSVDKHSLLLQAHFSRLDLSLELAQDLRTLLPGALSLAHALVDVASSLGWLEPCLAAIEFSQMLVQACWDYDSPLKQLPRMVEGVETVYDLMDLDPAARQLDAENEAFLRHYPNVEIQPKLESSRCLVSFKRPVEAPPQVHAPLYPQSLVEGWWFILARDTALVAIKRMVIKAGVSEQTVELEWEEEESSPNRLLAMCDGYLGADQEFDLP